MKFLKIAKNAGRASVLPFFILKSPNPATSFAENKTPAFAGALFSGVTYGSFTARPPACAFRTLGSE